MSLPGVPPLEQVCKRASTLPCSPTLLPRLTKLVQSDASTADDLEALILLDPALASATLRLANSAFFGGTSSECETVGEAIFRLGFREVYKVAVTTIGSRWLTYTIDGYGWEPGDFCRHSLCVAVAADLLAGQSGKVDRELAYTAGLIQDIGKLAIAYSCGEFFPAIRDHQRVNNCPWWQAEQAVLGYHQSEVGARLLEIWRFPQNLVVPVKHADHTADVPAECRTLLAHIHAAKFIATAIGPGVAEDGFLMELDPELLLSEGFTPDNLTLVQTEVLEVVTKLLKEKISTGPVQF